MQIKNSNNIILYTHSLYIVKDKNNTKYILPIAQPLLIELEKKGFNIKWFLRGSSKIYNKKTKRYSSPLNSRIHQFFVYADLLYKYSIKKFIPKIYSKFFLFPFFEYIYWIFIIYLIKPKLILGIEPSLELCRAARRFNISSIDIEHGLRDETSYFLRKDYRYRKDGYPNIILFSEESKAKIIKNIIPDYVKPKLSGFLEIIHYKEEILGKYKKNKLLSNNGILFISQYKKRGSSEPKNVPQELIEIINANELKLIIRVHPKLAQNEKIYKETLKFYHKNLNKKINFFEKKVIFTNPYSVSIWEDIIKTVGLVTENSASYRLAKLLKKPILVYSNELAKFEKESTSNKLFGFKGNLNKDTWEKFIKNCLSTKTTSYQEIYDIINYEVKKMKLLIKEIEKEISENKQT